MNDLFPETLLVARVGDYIYTTSRKVAEHFGKRHTHVLRSISTLIADLGDRKFTEPNFGLSEYIDNTGRVLPEYDLSHDGFALLAMGFTGREALKWKVAFLEAFRQMERDLQAQEHRYLVALDQIRPALRPVVEGTRLGLNRDAIGEPLGKSANAVTYHRGVARRLGLLT